MKSRSVMGLYGAGGFGREIWPLVRDTFLATVCELYFVETHPVHKKIGDWPVLSEEDFFGLAAEEKYFNIAIADGRARSAIAGRCLQQNIRPQELRAQVSTIYDNNEIGEAGIFCAYTTVTSNARIGRFFHANLYSYVAHDCVIGDFVTFAPNVHCNGRIHIGDYAYIGTGAILKPGSADKPLSIGEGAIIGMGAVVTRDVPSHTTVIGNPARAMTR